jgi:hypothetical protein
MATPSPSVTPLLGRQSRNLLGTCVRATCPGRDSLELPRPATPTAPAGILARRERGAQLVTAEKETG